MKVGIVGAGTMGSGIAQAFASCPDYQVKLSDVSLEFAQKGRDRIAAKLSKLVAREKITQEAMDGIVSRIEAMEKSALGDCDLIVEAALEEMQSKKALFAELDVLCGADTIFASNTSSLSITELAGKLRHQVVGMHFFNPADIMMLVEVISGVNTAPETAAKIKEIASDIGKVPVEVNESAGFVVNRILIPMVNEAVGVLADGVATAEDIDTAMKLGANHPMGPLALGDLIGLDVCLAIMEVLQAETGEDKYRPHPLLRKMVRGGLLGRKSGKGFFNYSK